MAEQITIKTGSEEIGAWHAAAKGQRVGGLIIVHEVFGVTNHIRNVCAEYAENGYEVIAPYLFDRIEKNFQGDPDNWKKALGLAERTKPDDAALDLQAVIDLLKPPVFMVGYCYGGSTAWVAACRCRGLKAASAYYGRLIIDYVDETPKIPIILHYGEHDDTIPMDNVRQIEAAHTNLEVYVYPAEHGFNADRSTHHAESARLARERTLAHFHSFT